MRRYQFFAVVCLLTCVPLGRVAAARTIEFETTEVTQADVALSPDGQWLVFTMLGHLFHLPVEGGTAEQLTFGPYYDTDHAISPDGSRVAFVSDRDGSEGNVFVLELAAGKIIQVTHEPWAGRPTWTPDGHAIVYLSSREPRTGTTLLRRIELGGGKAETVRAEPRRYRSIFYLPDGRLAWTVIEREEGSRYATTRVEVLSSQRTVSTLRTLEGIVERVIPNSTGDGFYCRRYIPAARAYLPHREDLLFVPLPGGAERLLLPLSNPRGYRPRFALATDNKSLYVGESGRLWKIVPISGVRIPIPFNAKVRLKIQEPVRPPKPILTVAASRPRGIVDPRLSPDGRVMVFGAAGYLWMQPLDAGKAQRLFQGSGFEKQPAFSPDGRQLAFVYSEKNTEEVRLFDFETRQTRTLTSGLSYGPLNWSPDGQRLVFAEGEGSDRRFVAVTVINNKKERLTDTAPEWWWWPRPHFSADGQALYFSGGSDGGALYRVRLGQKSKAEQITQFSGDLWNGLVSPDGKWLLFWRQMGIWLAPLGAGPVREKDVRQLTLEGGDTFTLSADGLSVIYSAGNRVWRQRLVGGQPEEIPIRLELPRSTPTPMLLRRVRVLDFKAGGFLPEASVFIEQGRISWIGSEHERSLPAGTVTLDAGGRFATPGLFEMHGHNYGGYFDGETFLAYGVTSVRDVGDWIVRLNELADRSDTTSDPLPRYFYAGDAVGDWVIHGKEEARTYVQRWKEWGAHFIKIHPPISWPLQRSVAEEARRLGLPVVAHGTTIEEITKGVTLGYSFLEHTNNHNPSYDDVHQLLAAAGTRWDPTLVAGGYSDLLLRDEPERLDDPKLQAFAPDWCIRAARSGSFMRQVDTASLRGRWAEQLTGVRAAFRRGVKLHAGTDVSCLIPQSVGSVGISLHWELEAFVQAGLPPLEVLRIATQEAAAAVGADNDLGTLEPGKLADIVLLDANPLEDIKNTQTIWRVIKGGWVFDPDKLRPAASTSSARDQKGD